MRYVSTRGTAPVLGFEDVLLTGLARDGGLYVPETWPSLKPEELRRLRGKSYTEIALAVIKPFVGNSVPEVELMEMIDAAYGSFGHRAVAPLKQLDSNQWLMELFHGPTLAFKDVAMQLISRLMEWALEKRQDTATIVGATSGDTGGAAIEAFRNSSRASIFILHPHGRVSTVQRCQMTTVIAPNVHNIALQGTFDDAQAHVKAMFNDNDFREKVKLSGVNSINWARIMAQMVYYFTAALALGAPDREVSFSVPTGNFGDIFAGYAAKRMGLPIARLLIATNVNDILDRALKTGRYEVAGVKPSTSPSMDIQVSSNFERLLFEAYGRDSEQVQRLMDGLKQSQSFEIDDQALANIRKLFGSARADEQETAETIRATLRESGELLDPHTAVGYAAAKLLARESEPMITLATAHPAKFPEAVERACGIRPRLPERLADLLTRPEKVQVLPNDLKAIKQFILERSGNIS